MSDALDLIDRRILAELMRDATVPVARLAERAGLSQTPCWKRVRRLEETGVILRQVAIVDPRHLGLRLIAFVGIEAPDHGAEWRREFAAVVAAMPEIVDAHRTAGDLDYLLRVVVADMAAFDAFYRRLTEAIALRNVTTHFAMEALKAETAYPVDTVSR